VTFAARLRVLLGRAGLTSYALARRSGVSKQSLSRILSGDSLPSWATVLKLAHALGATPNDFLPNGAVDTAPPRGQ
jgi:transcriptional regulator with XRE-family HTH domain